MLLGYFQKTEVLAKQELISVLFVLSARSGASTTVHEGRRGKYTRFSSETLGFSEHDVKIMAPLGQVGELIVTLEVRTEGIILDN